MRIWPYCVTQSLLLSFSLFLKILIYYRLSILASSSNNLHPITVHVLTFCSSFEQNSSALFSNPTKFS